MSSGWKPSAHVDRCPKCGKSVYANEAKLAAGNKWHTLCFKCGQYVYEIKFCRRARILLYWIRRRCDCWQRKRRDTCHRLFTANTTATDTRIRTQQAVTVIRQKDRIVAAHGRFSRIRQVAPMFTPFNTCFLRPTRFHTLNGISIGSVVFAQLTAEGPYTFQRAVPFPSQNALARGDLYLRLIHALGAPYSAPNQTASRSIQPFLHGSRHSSRHRVPILYNGPPLSRLKLPLVMRGDLDPI